MPRKGQTLSPEAIAQMKASKAKKMQSKFHWEIAEPYLDIIVENGSVISRKVKFITLRDFKKLVEEGQDLLRIKRSGISKHLVGFFSNFCQGKINLSKEKFIEEYLSGKSLEDIAKENDVTYEDITFLRELYNIKRLGATFQKRKKTEELLTQRQKEILYGSMMGDAKRSSPSSAGFGHGEKQKDYLIWKYKEFENIASKHSFGGKPYMDKRTGKEGISWRFYTHANTDIETCVSLFYETGKKQVNQVILDQLTPFSIAVWFMDDGKTDFFKRTLVNYDQKQTPCCTFCTESFSLESINLIKEWFFEKYNIKVRLKEKELSDRIGYRIIVENEDTDKFFGLISPYVLPLFQYKVNINSYFEKIGADDMQMTLLDLTKNLVGKDFRKLDKKEQDTIVCDFVNYYQKRTIFRLLAKPQHLKNSMRRVIRYNTLKLLHKDHIGFVTLGNDFVTSHFPNFFSAKSKGNLSPAEVFENKNYLSDIIRSIILGGKFPKGKSILSKMSRYRGNKIVSGFMPCVAKAIYDKYCNGESKVLDFCSGYGGRLLGSFSSGKVKSYTGIEVNETTYNNLSELANNIRKWSGTSKEITLFNQDSIAGMKQFSDNTFDFCFTSPPYFNAEEYSDDKNQSFKKYSAYSDWFELFLIASIKEARRISKKVAINIANTGSYWIADDLKKWLDDNNVHYSMDSIHSPRFGGKFRNEPIFVLEE